MVPIWFYTFCFVTSFSHWGWGNSGGGGRRSKVGCEMWMCVCGCSVGLSCQGRQFSLYCWIMAWYQFLRRVMKTTGKEKKWSNFSWKKTVLPWEHFGNRVPIGTLYLLLVSNLPYSTVMQNSVPEVFQREHCSQCTPTCFFWLASDTQMSNAVRACKQAKPILSRHVCASQELRTCQEQQQHTNTHLAQ